MGKAPAFQRYAGDYLADERLALMSLEEEGAYNRAQAYCWREGSIPSDEKLLSRLLKGASPETVKVVQRWFVPHPTDSSRLIDPELEEQREKRRLWIEKSSQAGRESGKARRAKSFSTEPTLNQPSKLVEPNANSSSSSSSSSSKQKRAPAAVVLPDWIKPETWNDFEEMRTKLRKPMTDRARRDIVAKLSHLREAGQDVEAVLAQSIRKGWQDVFDVKEEFFGKPNENRPSPTKQRIDGTRRGLARIAVEEGLVPAPGSDG
jgi:hypothetical protein